MLRSSSKLCKYHIFGSQQEETWIYDGGLNQHSILHYCTWAGAY